jgi:hypothetical protein
MGSMSNDQGQKPAAPISRAEAKTPLERARQIQEMQRQMDTQAPQQTAPTGQAAATQHAEAPQTAERVQQTHEVFEAKPVTPADQAAKAQPAEIQAYAKAQAPVQSLFNPEGQIEITGNPWKTIPFGDVLPGIVDLKKPLSDYNVKVPNDAFKLPQGNLFQITLSPKNQAKGEEPIKKPVIVDNNGKFKGAEFKTEGQVSKALSTIPSFATTLFEAVFGDGVLKDEPKNLKLGEVKLSEKSAFEVVVERKNDMTGKWKTELVHLNNFGMKVKPSADPKRFDIIVANYFKDGFTAV